jgi:hypothetical protein
MQGKTVLNFWFRLTFLLLLLQIKHIYAFQTISLSLLADESVLVEIKSEKSQEFWEFLVSYAGISGLEKRIQDLEFSDEDGAKVFFEKIAEGKFVVSKPVKNLSYKVKISIDDRMTGFAYVSWMNKMEGLLILSDLIPRNFESSSAKLTFNFPYGWKILSNNKQLDENSFFVERIEKAVFLVCREFQERSFFVGKTAVNFLFVGDWDFAESASKLAERIFAEYTKKLGKLSFQRVQICLISFPKKVRFNYWEAETKGANITIVSAPAVFKSNALNLLSEQLRHEILHLWVPNSLALRGNYDWFFEGFVVYQSLKTGVFMGEIRFEDFLSYLATAFRLVNQHDAFEDSLIELSEKRWKLPITDPKSMLFYAKSLLVAFMFDMNLLEKGKDGVEIVFRELLNSALSGEERANDVILAILKRYDVRLVEQYIQGTEKIDLQISKFGIQKSEASGVIKFEVAENLTSKQKNLLKKLGYNQWLKFSVKVKNEKG